MDVITAMQILPYEANPIYLLTGSVALLWIMKLVLIGLVFLVYFMNKYNKRSLYFTFVYILILGIFLSGVGAYSNINGMMNEETREYNEELSANEKIVSYFDIIIILFLIPYILGIVSFIVYDKTVDNVNLVDRHGNKLDRK